MAKKKKLLIVNDFLEGGGVEKLMRDLVLDWHKRYDITVFTYDQAKHFKDLYPSDVKYMFRTIEKHDDYKGLRLFAWKVHKKLREIWFDRRLESLEYDQVLCMKDGWVMREVAKMPIADKIAWNHTDYNHYYYTKAFYETKEEERQTMMKFRKVICVAEDVKKGIIDVIGDPGNLVVCYNPIPVKDVLEKAEEPVVDMDYERDCRLDERVCDGTSYKEQRSESDLQEKTGKVRFVTVGRLNYQKGYDLLLEACHMLDQDGLDYEVWVIGGEESWSVEHERLYRAKERLGVKNVHFLGGRKNPYKYMKQADWFLSTSLFEGYSLVSQEAAVLGIPLILTECSGVKELLGDEEYGIIMKISVQDIYQGMKRVIEYPGLHEKYSRKIKERRKVITYRERIRIIEETIR